MIGGDAMIRQATKDDIPAIRELMRSEPDFWQDTWRDDVIRRGLASAGDLAFVWEDTGQILGFVCAHDMGFRAYLSELIVSRSARARGVGRELVRRVQRQLRARGCAVLVSDVWKGAAGFYESLGWSAPDVVLLRKRLGDDRDGE